MSQRSSFSQTISHAQVQIFPTERSFSILAISWNGDVYTSLLGTKARFVTHWPSLSFASQVRWTSVMRKRSPSHGFVISASCFGEPKLWFGNFLFACEKCSLMVEFLEHKVRKCFCRKVASQIWSCWPMLDREVVFGSENRGIRHIGVFWAFDGLEFSFSWCFC